MPAKPTCRTRQPEQTRCSRGVGPWSFLCHSSATCTANSTRAHPCHPSSPPRLASSVQPSLGHRRRRRAQSCKGQIPMLSRAFLSMDDIFADEQSQQAKPLRLLLVRRQSTVASNASFQLSRRVDDRLDRAELQQVFQPIPTRRRDLAFLLSNGRRREISRERIMRL